MGVLYLNPNTPKVIDLYAGNESQANWDKLVSDGYRGVIFKFGQGEWPDVPRRQPTWWKDARSAGLLTGCYWLKDARHNSAEEFDVLMKWTNGDWGELGLWLDIEKPVLTMKDSAYYKLGYAGIKDVVNLAYLVANTGISRFPGHLPGIYTSSGMWALLGQKGISKAHADYLAQAPLWTAQYLYAFVDGVSKPRMFGSWKSWTFWQICERPDIDIFNGPADDFDSFIKQGAHYVTPEEPEEIDPYRLPRTLVILDSARRGLMVRNAPGTVGTKVVGAVYPPRAITVTQVELVGKDVWCKFDWGWVAKEYKGTLYGEWSI